MGAVWGDFDNDGLEDVLIYKWGYLQLFKNMGNLHFKDVTEAAGLRHWMNANGAVWFDYDRDGLLDLYVGGYYRSDIDFWHLKTTRIMENSFEFATNGGKNRLFHNLGGGRFEDVTEIDRKSTRLNSRHLVISYAVFCLKKKNNAAFGLVF